MEKRLCLMGIFRNENVDRLSEYTDLELVESIDSTKHGKTGDPEGHPRPVPCPATTCVAVNIWNVRNTTHLILNRKVKFAHGPRI